MGKVIIIVVFIGVIHIFFMFEYFFFRIEDLIEEVIRFYNVGVVVVYIHVRNFQDGMLFLSVDIFKEVLSGIKVRLNVVIIFIIGGSYFMIFKERFVVVSVLKFEMVIFNVGLFNFVFYLVLQKYKKFKYDWEEDYFIGIESFIFLNYFESLYIYLKIMNEMGIRFEIEIYDVGQINNVVQLVKEGYFKILVYFQYVMGILGGILVIVDNFFYMIWELKRLFDEDFIWFVCVVGRFQFLMGIINVFEGGFWRVGFEDNLYFEKGVFVKSSVEQVEKVIWIICEFGYEFVILDEVREMLVFKGIDKVNYQKRFRV